MTIISRYLVTARTSRIVAAFLATTTLATCIWIYFVHNDFISSLGNVSRQSTSYLILDYVGYLNRNYDVFVGNCRVTQNRSVVGVADVIAVTTRRLKRKEDLPRVRHPWQRWVWILDESPYHGVDGQPFKLSHFNNIYNWTMTYRSNSDVYIPYGWTRKKEKADTNIPDLGKRDKFVAAVISNCSPTYVHNGRLKYVQELGKTVSVTVYGRCGRVCDGYNNSQLLKPCPDLKNYKFNLAFENANCKEYITEKIFSNAFDMGAVPVVMGASRQDYVQIAPPNSFIYAKDFSSARQLGDYLQYLSRNLTAYMEYHEWRKEYRTEYRIQYIDDSVWHPLCEKLNGRNNKVDSVSSLSDVFSVKDCNETPLW